MHAPAHDDTGHDDSGHDDTPHRSPGRVRSAVAGATAAAVALAAGELVAAALGSSPSLVTAVGSEFVDRFAASLKDLAVALFGTNDKVALVVGIVVTSLLLGAALGLASVRSRLAVPMGFAAFAVVGASALATDPQGSAGIAIVAAAAAGGAGIASFALLQRLGSSPVPADASHGAPAPGAGRPVRRTVVDRRGFVLGVGGLVLGAAASHGLTRQLRSGDVVATARRTTVLPRPTRAATLPPPAGFTVPGISPYITPVPEFYRIDTALTTPQVDPTSWRLSVTGLVDRPFDLSYDELLSLDSVEEVVTIQCVSNEVGGDLIGNAVWQGVPLASILERAAVRTGSTQVVGRSVDGWTAGFPTADALDGRTALVAYAMNGDPLTAAHGFPARLVVSGLYGYVSATKWLREIELTTWEAFDGYWVPRGWSKEGPIKTASRIDVPRAAVLEAGRQPIAGVAWAPHRGIARVEVSIDGGPWLECELGPVASTDTWVQWHLAWDAVTGDHELRVRATDGLGITQTGEIARPAPDGATGWHTRRVRVA